MLCVPCVTVNGVTFLLGMARTAAITPRPKATSWPFFAQLVSSFKRKLMVTAYSPGLSLIHISSLHPLDLLVGLCCGAGLRLAVYLKSKNAKKYRHGMEYGLSLIHIYWSHPGSAV